MLNGIGRIALIRNYMGLLTGRVQRGKEVRVEKDYFIKW